MDFLLGCEQVFRLSYPLPPAPHLPQGQGL